MYSETIPLEETDCFSQTFIEYLAGKENLKAFYGHQPSIESFEAVIKNRRFPQESRETLSKTLKKQYQHLDVPSEVTNNLQLLKQDNTFTITTGHQLNIFTGPLYFIYKIITVINACKTLKKKYPTFHFVPVYWMASEDHDFDEISYFFFEGEKKMWKTDQSGAVGRFTPKELAEIATHLPSGASFFKEAYDEATLSQAVRSYVNHLFAKEGLIVIDADDPALKKSLIPVINDDLFEHHAEKIVSQTSEDLETLGHKTQVTPREVNFFYLNNNIRERIEKTSEGFKVVNTDITFSDEEVRDLIEELPDRFSPNVILRPLYQEIILPNLAYVGGPSELVYWLQLKGIFEYFETAFPLLVPRNFGLVLPKKHKSKWESMGFSKQDLFKPGDTIFSKWVAEHSNLDLSYKQELELLKDLEGTSKAKASQVDKTLTQHLEAIHASFAKKLEKAEKKILRAEKKKHAEKKKQIADVIEVIFPGGTLQERKENFLSFYLKDPQFIQRLLDTFDPFNYQMYLLYE